LNEIFTNGTNGSFASGDDENCFDFPYTQGDILEVPVTFDAGLDIQKAVL
jgi:hypothetical protein